MVCPAEEGCDMSDLPHSNANMFPAAAAGAVNGQANGNAVQTAQAARPAAGSGEIRLSFGYFYVVLKWGSEKRSSDRLKDERRRFPVVTATHAPVLAAVWAIIFLVAYMGLSFGLKALSYLVA
jgi:hypothetical protein